MWSIIGHLSDILATCKSIAENISNYSKVFYPPALEYYESIKHYAITSTTFSVCSVEPGTATDIAIIVSTMSIDNIPAFSENTSFCSCTVSIISIAFSLQNDIEITCLFPSDKSSDNHYLTKIFSSSE